MSSRSNIAIDIDRRCLRAVQAERDGRRLVVKRMVVEPVPETVDGDDPDALGAWMRGRLEAARIPRERATFAITREDVALKRMAMPTTDETELPEMTRLALRRELPFDADGAVIDFVSLERRERTTVVMAAAVPREVLEFTRRVARAAGFGVDRVSLRTMGSASLLGGMPQPESGGTLAVDVTSHRVEFSVIVDGQVRFSRACDLPEIAEPAGLAEAVITETRRTWMSYRIVDDSEQVRRAVVFGDSAISERAAGSIGDILKVPAEVLATHPLVDAAGNELEGAWPLAGLLLEPALERPTIDFVNPHEPPDVGRRKRVLTLGAAGVVVLAALAAFTVGRRHINDLQDAAAALESRKSVLAPQFARYGRDLYKVTHLQQWESASADWLAHLDYIVSLTPPPDRLVLDGVTGTVRFSGVTFDRRERSWSAPREIRIVLEGEAADRATADAFRGALVATETYEITTTGPDAQSGRRLPYAFTYHMRTTVPAPPAGAEGDGEPAVAALPRGERQ